VKRCIERRALVQCSIGTPRYAVIVTVIGGKPVHDNEILKATVGDTTMRWLPETDASCREPFARPRAK
jgi:hypothetical protein